MGIQRNLGSRSLLWGAEHLLLSLLGDPKKLPRSPFQSMDFIPFNVSGNVTYL